MPKGPLRKYGLPEPDPVPGSRFVDCGDGAFALVDEGDWDKVKALRWGLGSGGEPKANFPNGDGTFSSVQLKAAVLMVRAGAGQCIKNLNGDPFDCRSANLRLMSLAESRALDRSLGIDVKRKPRRSLNKRLERPSVAKKRLMGRGGAESSVLKGLGEKS